MKWRHHWRPEYKQEPQEPKPEVKPNYDLSFKEFIIQSLSSDSSLSSKRVCGLLGWIICIALCVYCVISLKEAPDVVDLLFICSTSLLGIDSITNIWKK